MLTIRECLSFGGLSDAKVLAGKDYIDREVRNISILEIADPSVSQWASSYELYISSFYSVKDDYTAQEHIIRALAGCHCSGLIIGHIGLHIKQIKPELLHLCEELQFPLIAANPSLNYLAIMNPIYYRLMRLPRDPEFRYVRSDIIKIALTEPRIHDALKKISAVSDLAVSFFDYKYHCLYSNKSENITFRDQQMLLNFHESNRFPNDESFEYADQLIIVVKNDDLQRNGFAIIDKQNISDTQLGESFYVAFSILLSRRFTAAETKREFIREYWKHLENRDFASDASAIEMGNRIGVRIQLIHHILIVRFISKNDKTALEETISNWLISRIKSMIKALNRENISFVYQDCIINLLADCEADEDLSILGKRLENLFSTIDDFTVSIGISNRFESVAEIADAYRQSVSAADIGLRIYGKNHSTHYYEVWGYEYASGLNTNPEVHKMCQKKLKGLLDNDASGELLRTLKVLIQCNSDISIAAMVLNVHRNTVVYRKAKIIELLKEDPFLYPQNFIYQMVVNII